LQLLGSYKKLFCDRARENNKVTEKQRKKQSMVAPQPEIKTNSDTAAVQQAAPAHESQAEKRVVQPHDLTGQLLASNDPDSKKIVREYRRGATSPD
jgi:hypothetical protein